MKTNDFMLECRKSKRRTEKDRRVNPYLHSEPDERKRERRIVEDGRKEWGKTCY